VIGGSSAAAVWKRRARSWMNDAPVEFVFLAILSIPCWVIFELYNKYTLHNWHYLGLPDSPIVRNLGYAWSFATMATSAMVATAGSSSRGWSAD